MTPQKLLQIPTKQEKKCLVLLRKFISESPSLRQLQTGISWEFSDDFLLRYIRSRGYNINSAFERLHVHMTTRIILYPELFSRLYPSAVYHMLKSRCARVLKFRDFKNRRILLFRISEWNPEIVTVDDLLIGLMLIGWEILGDMETQINGVVVLVDGCGFGFKHAKFVSPTVVKKWVEVVLKSTPFKCKKVHIINAPTIFNMTLSIVKMMLPTKLGRRIHFHGHTPSTTLHKYLPPQILPEFLGGELSEQVAMDNILHDELFTKAKNDYYKMFLK